MTRLDALLLLLALMLVGQRLCSGWAAGVVFAMAVLTRPTVAAPLILAVLGLGGIAAPLIGKLADMYSIRTVLTWVSIIPVITIFLILRFPRKDADPRKINHF
mgnify:CR=1 FL=1